MGKRVLKIFSKEFILTIIIVAALMGADQIIKRALTDPSTVLPVPINKEFFLTSAHVALLGLGIFVLYKIVQSTIYRLKTGRNYGVDHSKYKRSYSELVKYFCIADTHLHNLDGFKAEKWEKAEGIMFGTVGRKLINLPSDSEGNIFVAGSPGSRKTTGVVIPTCARYGGSVLAIDIKGDIYNFCKDYRSILRFCPDLKDEKGNSIAIENSAHFNPFGSLSGMSESDKKLFLENMALALIPDKGSSDGDYFSSRARNLFVGITHFLLSLKSDLTFPELLHAILHHQQPSGIQIEPFPIDVFGWVNTIRQSDCLAAVERVASLYRNSEKNVSGAFDCLATALTPFSNNILDTLLDGKGSSISCKSLEDGYDIYLQIDQDNLLVYAPLFTMMVSSFISDFTRRPDTSTRAKNRPILILLYEFPQLSFNYDMINSALSTLRSKSVQCMRIAQNVAQLSREYQNDGWRSLLGNCQYQLVLGTNEELTQKHFSTLFGSRRILKISNSDSLPKTPREKESRTITEDREPIYQMEDFGDLGDRLIIYYNGKRIEAKKIWCYE